MEGTFMSRHRVWSSSRLTIIMRCTTATWTSFGKSLESSSANHLAGQGIMVLAIVVEEFEGPGEDEDPEEDPEEFGDFIMSEDSLEPIDPKDEDP
ncbi:hypothetical protein FNV43_RR11108 [Rhamnella rubrinervis]|uniref:Uncharacterized protein n=1 Tax=Rhamnella rubrinervis TaxID=2594499 RepID=A0A8K0H580_9ROSA|nr:hypothetical protein FNV43_RR11108 [Rhamnella rubrinervis]